MTGRSELEHSISRMMDSMVSPERRSSFGIVGIGIDVVTDERMEEIGAPGFIQANFTEREIEYCTRPKSQRVQKERFAARWAAKEAVVKALGGIGVWDFKELEVIHTENGAPEVRLGENARNKAQSLGVDSVLISFSHENDISVALCIAAKNSGSGV